ncbi:hypothetical protein PN36_29695 [Candidatus Thiomargarita nelsonii]|uniref:VWFA domain-containing protein n=1 Tax=Candidatus Thiomargarita nelsonii TaxID=1003181 RepID=A0A4E0QPH2_9GAMM|nr:hypothetical protein PN36_29695 [Candidatus Thiomargarita nelsonii]
MMTNDRITLPSSALNPVFGKISYRPVDDKDIEVMFTILMPTVGEGWQTGIALDASTSMEAAYGKAMTGEPPAHILTEYQQRGWTEEVNRDGMKNLMLSSQAVQDSLAKGYLHYTENVVQTEARHFIQYLAQNLDADGGTTVIYWACGEGDKIEILGDVRAEECPSLSITGPKKTTFGNGTHLLPALKYFVERFVNAPNAMYIFVTDGRFDDLNAVKRYCIDLAKDIESGGINPMKAVLIGIGNQIDENQMIELDDLETGTHVDIWDHKIAADMREVTEIFAELVDESMIVAPQGTIYDETGQRVARFTDGLPARVSFRMPKTSNYFELEVAGQERIRQSIN